MSNSIKVFAPATVANVGPGYDVLGFALEGIGDVIEMSLTDEEGIEIQMPDSDLPTDPSINVAGVAAKALLDAYGKPQGLKMIIHKKVKAGSGLGSSASSSAGAAFALNELLYRPFTKHQLVDFAMAGETASSGKAHADNVAPSTLGGFTLVRSYHPLDVVSLTYPEGLIAVVVHPQIEVKTSDSKKMLRKDIPLEMAVAQWGNVAGLVSGLASGDYDLIGRSLEDVIVEPIRAMLIPGFDQLKRGALDNGALGCSISGSGPSVFALCHNMKVAQTIAKGFKEVFQELDIQHDVHVSHINKEGCKVID
jgi:homoserine kinase